ncbi:MAG: DUF1080 domain-containing protein, partial [Bacteroidota bacterium]
MGGVFEEEALTEGRQVIFNGKDIRNWEEEGDFEVEIKNDALFLTANTSEGGYLLSEKSYKNFVLNLEFLAPFINSGIAFRWDKEKGMGLDTASYVLNLDWDKAQQNPMGSIIFFARAKLFDSLDAGQWHKLRLEALGYHLRVFINEDLVAETHDRTFVSGKLALLLPSEAGQTIGFRELILEEFPEKKIADVMMEHELRRSKKSELISLFPTDDFDGWNPVG